MFRIVTVPGYADEVIFKIGSEDRPASQHDLVSFIRQIGWLTNSDPYFPLTYVTPSRSSLSFSSPGGITYHPIEVGDGELVFSVSEILSDERILAVVVMVGSEEDPASQEDINDAIRQLEDGGIRDTRVIVVHHLVEVSVCPYVKEDSE